MGRREGPLSPEPTPRRSTLFTADEEAALVALLKGAIDADRYPLSLRSILAKLELSRPPPAPLPPLRRYEPPRHTASV